MSESEDLFHWTSGAVYPKESRWLCLPLSVGVLILGILGVSIGVACLAAYAVCQVPTIRSAFGNYFYNTTQPNMDDFEEIEYTIEICVCVISGLLGILANALLIYAVLKTQRWFLMHWLVLHTLVIISGMIATILVAVLQDELYKIFCLIPAAITVLTIYCWIKVYQLFSEMDVEVDPPLPCLHHPYGMGTYMTSGEWPQMEDDDEAAQDNGGQRFSAWPSRHQAALEFYPVDHLSRKMQARLTERPFWRRSSSVDELNDDRNQNGDEDGSEDSFPPANNDNTYATLPDMGKLGKWNQRFTVSTAYNNAGFESEDLDEVGASPGRQNGLNMDRESHGHSELLPRLSQESKTDSNISQVEI